MALSWDEEKQAVKEAVESFPEKFGLRAFPGDTFRVSNASSYYSSAYGVMVYTERLMENGKWASFAKGTPRELRRELVKL